MRDQLIRFEQQAPIVRIVLHRAEKMNPLSNALRDQLETALFDAEADDEIRVVPIKGAGQAFSAAYDLGETSRRPACRPR